MCLALVLNDFCPWVSSKRRPGRFQVSDLLCRSRSLIQSSRWISVTTKSQRIAIVSAFMYVRSSEQCENNIGTRKTQALLCIFRFMCGQSMCEDSSPEQPCSCSGHTHLSTFCCIDNSAQRAQDDEPWHSGLKSVCNYCLLFSPKHLHNQ